MYMCSCALAFASTHVIRARGEQEQKTNPTAKLKTNPTVKHQPTLQLGKTNPTVPRPPKDTKRHETRVRKTNPKVASRAHEGAAAV